MKKILVTGADGFIGQHLCRYLIDNGYQVRGLYHETRPLYFISKQEIEWVKADLRDQSSIKHVTVSIDIVIHLAAIPRNDLRKTCEDFHAINVNGTNYLLKEAQKSGVKKFIFISTVEAAGYGNGINPRTEDEPPKPDINYGKSKLETEKLVLSDRWNFKSTVLRLPMIYGPRTRETVRWTTRNINIISTEKFQKTTGFKPPYSIDQGCSGTVKRLEINYFNKGN